ncbi:hypothetical protein ASE27_03925 [Oerskovia sp. Root918]|uniref:DUF2142 domain-containing protein n=1 Tax=Oerskovia sp. Root918 TaxID=1736607 RepID=UPI0007012FD3|nr:DUF2142 domain-containing protein [Oerskovia sp. Root918]KRD47477.1 hypothetical protein ASE27_03925 [Oerskovia sp. Root918]
MPHHTRTHPFRSALRLVTPSGSLTPRAAFWWAFAAYFLVSSLWAISNPIMASADEPSHVVKAAATVRGAEDISPDGASTGTGWVELPSLYAQLARYADCIMFQSGASASCQPTLEGDLSAPQEIDSSAINYNPAYYAVVGLPALLPGGGEHTLYLMRLMNALVCAAIMGLAARTVAELPRRRWLGLALLLPLTPTFVNLTGAVNPQSFEVTGAVLLWLSCLAIVRHPAPDLLNRRIVRIVLATALVALPRSLGPLWVALIVVMVVVSTGWRPVVDAVRHRKAIWGIAACVAICAAASFWILNANAVPQGPGGPGITQREAILRTLGDTSTYLHQMLAALGWLDVPIPGWLHMTLAGTILTVAILAWAVGLNRDKIAIAASAVLVVLIPIAAQVPLVEDVGYYWQGRYTFPIAFGVILLAVFALAERSDGLPPWFVRRTTWTIGLLFAVANISVFVVNLHRYVNGAWGGWFKTDAASWTPPLPILVLVVAYGVAWFALVVVAQRVAGEDAVRSSSPSTSATTVSLEATAPR